MAKDLRFAYEPVRLIFEQTKSFSKTLVVLPRIMEAGNKVGNETLAELALEEEEEANQSHILEGLFFDTRHKLEAKRSSLNVNPFLDDDPNLHLKAEPSDLTSDTRKLSEEEMYDLFGGPLPQSTVEDSQSLIQPEQEVRAEFKRLTMTVTAHDTTALEEFKQKLDPDVLRAWTMELILERTAPPLKSSP